MCLNGPRSQRTAGGVWSVLTTIVLDAQHNVMAINPGVASERRLRGQFIRRWAAPSDRLTAKRVQGDQERPDRPALVITQLVRSDSLYRFKVLSTASSDLGR
jgi:hypothetical protein